MRIPVSQILLVATFVAMPQILSGKAVADDPLFMEGKVVAYRTSNEFPDVEVIIVYDTGEEHNTKTDENGDYSFHVPVEVFSVTLRYDPHKESLSTHARFDVRNSAEKKELETVGIASTESTDPGENHEALHGVISFLDAGGNIIRVLEIANRLRENAKLVKFKSEGERNAFQSAVDSLTAIAELR